MSVQGHGKHTLLFPIISQETENIASMIEKQRKPVKVKQRFRYSALETEDLSSNSSQYTVNRLKEFREWNPPIDKSQIKHEKPSSELNYSVPSLPSTISVVFPADCDNIEILTETASDDERFFEEFPQNAVRFASDIIVIDNISDVMEPSLGFYRVRISNVYSPYKLWFQLDNKHLTVMNDELQAYYDNLHEKELLFDEIDIQEKRACVARHEGKWYRGEIVSNDPEDNGHYKIYFFDYGKVEYVSPKCIKFFVNQFLKIPRQAFRGRLAFVKPKDVLWTSYATRKLIDFVGNVILFAKLEHFTSHDNCHYLSLIHTYTEDDIKVEEYLVSECSDVLSCEAKGKSSLKLIIPTFNMLEEGIFENVD